MAITKILNIQAADDRNPATHLKNAIEYIQNPDKTEECVLVGSINCLPDTAFEQMLETKKLYHKTGKRQGYHIIISFSPEEVVTPEQALYVVEHFAKDVLGDDYEAVYTVHTDKEHMHAHLIWNSVSLVTGKKYNSPKGNWKNKLQPITNKYCEELGLEICPAEYSKNPVNMTRDEWQKEQEFKELIFREAQFCAYSAGSVEHFEFLMKKLGYEFQPGKYLRVRIPGRKIYHRLDKMHEMFEEGKLQYWVDMPYMAKPYFYSGNPEKIYHAGMSDYQKKFYAKMYRMRVIEHKRFDYKSAYYAEELRKLNEVHEKYLLLVKNDIRDIGGLIDFMENKQSEIKSIDERQHEIYKENQRRKRKIVTTEDMREYQRWHLLVEQELDKLKEGKKKAKYDYKLAGNILRERTYIALSDKMEKESVMDADEVVMPEYVSERDEEDKDFSAGVEEVTKFEDKKESVEDIVSKDDNMKDDVEDEKISEDAIFEDAMLDDITFENVMSKEVNAENVMLDNIPTRDNMLVESDIVKETVGEVLYTDIEQYEYTSEQCGDSLCNSEEIMTGDFPKRYTEYMALALEKRVNLHGLLNEKLGVDVFDVVRKNFDKIGYSVRFDDIYNETIAIEKYISEQKRASRVEVIAEKLKGYGSYENIPSSVKAEVFGFEIDDSGGDLKLYMQVIKALGVRMGQEEMFGVYQKVYEETIKKQNDYEMQNERMWERGSAK